MMNLYEEAKRCFLVADPVEKMHCTQLLASTWKDGKLGWTGGEEPELLIKPGALDKPELVAPQKVRQRGFKSAKQRAALIHALAHIELTAVNLCLDDIYRYRNMPKDFYDDWIQTADDESRHFLALRQQLLSMGFDYGDFPVHDELWQITLQTAGDPAARMGIVHRVMEARSLDVVPATVSRFNELGEHKTARVLTDIANDEVAHVFAGSRWFRYYCQQQGLSPDQHFFTLIERYFKAPPKGPFNMEDRRRAGFSDYELKQLEENDKKVQAEKANSRNNGSQG